MGKRRGKYRIINIRGSNGSGKSHIVRELMAVTDAKPVYGNPGGGKLLGGVVGYRGDYEGTPIYFVGSYEVMSGGADHVMKHIGIDYLDELIRRFSREGHVIFEGFIVSGLFSRYLNLSRELGGIVWCYIDTPLEVCYSRIEERNRERSATAGRVRESVGVKHVEKKFVACARTKEKFAAAGERVVSINYRRPLHAIHQVLRG